MSLVASEETWLGDAAENCEVPRPTVSRCLHVGNVGVRTTEDHLRSEFGQFGRIEDVKIVHQGGERRGEENDGQSDATRSCNSSGARTRSWRVRR